LPWIQWMKKACPTAYAYQYDDSSSTFQCGNKNPSSMNTNTVGYTITFCPGGKSVSRIKTSNPSVLAGAYL
jgi:hypothetical protein